MKYEAVRHRPYSVVLFDEIEKAHPDVFNILLQVLDDGRLTDGKGRTVDFKNTIIIMTSNLGSQHIQKMQSIGFSDDSSSQSYESTKKKVMESLKDFFRPEFLNRLDDIIVFDTLSQEVISMIVKNQLALVTDRLQVKGITVSYDKKLISHLAEKGFDPKYGARPLKRLIQNELLNELALKMIKSEIKAGDTIIADFDKNNIVITKKTKRVRKTKKALTKAA